LAEQDAARLALERLTAKTPGIRDEEVEEDSIAKAPMQSVDLEAE
jgi:hypothetical protein